MKLLLHDYAGHSFQVELSRELAARGHIVRHVYCQSTHTPQGELSQRPDDPPGFDVRGIALSQTIPKTSFVRRFRLEREYARRLVDECERFGPDAVLSANTPSIAQYRLANWCQRNRVRLVSWIQDMYGLAAYRLLKLKLPVVGHIVGKYFIALDKASARISDQIVVITEDFRDVLVSWGIDSTRIHVVHNWSSLEQIPLRRRDNEWAQRQELGAGDRELGNSDGTSSSQSPAPTIRFLYSGTLAMKHNPALLLELARLLDREHVGQLVVVSEGAGVQWLAEQAAADGLRSLRCLGFQPYDVFADVLASADVLVAILEADAGVFSVPSKVLSYLCAGRAVLMAVPRENLAARIVVECGAGVAVEPSDVAGFCCEAGKLIASSGAREQHGAAGRRYAEAHFDIRRIADRFESIVSGASRKP
jgi:colanic acid biosynthesis glycosyl transferase WcaI